MEEQTQTNGTEGQCQNTSPKIRRRKMRKLRKLEVQEEKRLTIQPDATLYDDKFLASQALYRNPGHANAKCSLCGKCKTIKGHTEGSRHVTALPRFRRFFDVRGTLAVCVSCNVRVDWTEVAGHLAVHRVMPWYRPDNVYARFFSEGTWKLDEYLYCWACETLSSSWSEGLEHCDLESHRGHCKGQIAWSPGGVVTAKTYKRWISEGFTPGEGKRIDCQLCQVSFEPEDSTQHWNSDTHKIIVTSTAEYILRVQNRRGLAQPTSGTPSCKDSTPSRENLSPSCNDFGPLYDNATTSCGNDKPLVSFAPLFKNVTPSCEKPAPFCENKLRRSENTAQSCARSSTKANMQQRDGTSLDFPNDPEANSFDALTFLIGPHTQKLEKGLKETFVPARSQKFTFYCVICADPIRDMKNAQDHVSGRLHAVSSKKYGCKSIVSTGNGYYCNCCDQKMDLLSVVYRHVLDNEHAFNMFAETAVQEEIVKSNSKEALSCEKSNTVSKTSDVASITGNSIKAVSTSTSSPDGRCSVNLTETSKSSGDHDALEGLDFVIGPHIPNLSNGWQQKLCSVRSRGFALYCLICDAEIGDMRVAREHVSGRRHAKSMQKYKCGDITSIEDGYHCKCCDQKIDRLSLVYRHVLGKEHERHVQIRIPESKDEKAPSREHSRHTSEDATPSCERSNTATKTSGLASIAGNSKKAVSTSTSSRNGRCSVNLTETSKSSGDLDALEELDFVIGPHIPNLSNGWQQKLCSVRNRGFALYCLICDAEIGDMRVAREHVSGRRHAKSMQKYKCGDITLIEDGYYCKCCDQKIERLSLVYRHVLGKEHERHVQIRIPESKDEKAPSREHSRHTSEDATPSCERSNTATKTSGLASIAGNSKKAVSTSTSSRNGRCSVNLTGTSKSSGDLDALEELDFVIGPHIPNLSNGWQQKLCSVRSRGFALYCLICDAEIDDMRVAREHVSGRRHAKSMQKYKCGDITSVEDGYHCKCCDQKIDRLSLVYRHVLGKEHERCVQIRIPESKDEEAPSREHSRRTSEDATPSCERSNTATKTSGLASITGNSKKGVSTSTSSLDGRCSVNLTETSKSSGDHDALEELDFVIGPHIPNLSNGWQQKICSVRSRGFALYCLICDAEIGDMRVAREHVSGRRHAKSMQKYKCGDITSIEDGYYCKCCDQKIDRLSLVYRHVLGKEHERHVQIRIPESKEEEAPSREHSRRTSEDATPSGERSNTATKTSGLASITGNSKKGVSTSTSSLDGRCSVNLTETSKSLGDHDALEELDFVIGPHIPNLSNGWQQKLCSVRSRGFALYCLICDAEIGDMRVAWEHVSGQRHAKSMQKYKCGDITSIEDGYHCKCCDQKIDRLSLVYRHVLGKEHERHVQIRIPESKDEGAPSLEHSRRTSENATPSCERSNTATKTSGLASITGNSKKAESTSTLSRDGRCSVNLTETSISSGDHDALKELDFVIGPHIPNLCNGWQQKLCSVRSRGFLLYCLICDSEIGDMRVAREHVSGQRHAMSMKKYKCGDIASIEDGYHCKCCNQKIDRLSFVYRHVLAKEHVRHVQLRIPESNDEEAPSREHSRRTSENETPSCERSNAASETPCPDGIYLDAINGDSRKDVSTLSSSSSSSTSSRDDRCSANLTEPSQSLEDPNVRFLKDFNFVIGPHIPRLCKIWNQVLKIEGRRGFVLYCVICDDAISDIESAREHVSGQRHANSMVKYRCDEITSIEDGYYCKCCDHKMKRLPVAYRHAIMKQHAHHLQERIAESDGQEGPADALKDAGECLMTKDAFEAPSREHSRDTSENSTPSCERSNAASKTPCPDGIYLDAINGDSRKDVSTLSSSSSRYDRCSVNVTETSQSLEDPNVRFLKDFTFVIGSHIPRLCKIWNQVLKSASRRGFVLYCVICDDAIPDIESAREHVSGQRHANSMVKYRCDEITSIEDGYYCKCCDHKMKRLPVAYRHAIMKQHAHHLQERIAESDRQEGPANALKDAGECLMTKDAFEAPSREHSRDTSENSTPSCEGSNTASKGPDKTGGSKKGVSSSRFNRCSANVTESSHNSGDSNSRFLEDLTFLVGPHTPKPGKKLKKKITWARKVECAFYCVICADPIRDIDNAREHVSDQRHIDSMKKYGCENIVTTEKGYYCNCCNCEMNRLYLVFRHVIRNGHAHYLQVRQIESETKNGIEISSCPAKSMPSCKNAARSSANVTPFYESAVSSCKALTSAYVSCESSSRTSENSTPSLKHTAATPLGGSYDHIVQLGKNKYTCRICGKKRAPIGDVHVHIQGNRHQKALKKLGCASIATQENGEPHETTRACPWNLEIGSLENVYLHNKKFEGVSSLFPVNREVEKLETAPRSENEAAPRNSLYDYIALKMAGSTPETLTDEMYEDDTSEKITKDSKDVSKKKTWTYAISKVKVTCPICGKVVPDRTSLHCHLASHFSHYFVSATASNNNSREIELSNFELDDDCVSDDDRTIDSSSPLPEPLTLNKPMETRTFKRKIDARMTLAILNFDKDVIYEMTDKTAEYELCSKLCVILDSSNLYCLVCREPVPNRLQNFYDHLSSLNHCAYLEMMEKDAARFAGCADQFSDLDLAQEYMEEISDESVQCYACRVSVANETAALRAHIYETGHIEAWKVLRAAAARIADLLKPRASCDWYRIQQYWCVPCRKPCSNEVKFVAHLESAAHLKMTSERAVKGKTMLLDYCPTCALLWYGYRVTRFYHEQTPAHVITRRDGDNSTRLLSKFGMSLLAKPEAYADARIRRLDKTDASERSKQRVLLEELEEIVRTKFSKAKAHTFGSRIAGLSSENSDLDVFLDCRNIYSGGESESVTAYFIKGVYDCLRKHPNSWDVDELLTSCRAPIIRVHHRETDLKCDLSFQNGLGVENTKLIRTYCDVYPPCRKLILIVKQWLAYCSLADSRVIKNYCLSWLVIFYLQNISILPSVATLVTMKNKSQKIAGWEVGVSHDFTCYEAHFGIDDSSPIVVQLLKGFFGFYADFDFRREVVCPLLGYPVAKRDFIDTRKLPDAMKLYKQYVSINSKPELFSMDSPMCVQDPFRMNDNLAKYLNKRHLNAFRVYCAESLNFISSL